MVIGRGPIGSGPIGAPLWNYVPRTEFAIDQSPHGDSVLVISDLVGKRLVEFFRKNPNEMRTMNRRRFEELVAELFHGFGFEVELTQQTRDGGKDIVAVRRDIASERFLIECKRPDPGGYVGIKPVRELFAVKHDEGATKAILATTAYFSPDAKIFFERNRWELEGRDYDGLVEWINLYHERKQP